MHIQTHFLPRHVVPERLTDSVVVVIDILRATTTLTRALEVGASPIIPCQDLDEARRIADQLPESRRLGGERGGRRIEGFDLGNSPFEYTSESVGGRGLVFTTTNGTRAMRHASHARRVLLGAFSSLSAIVNELRSAHAVALLCAGTDGEVTQEDVLFAGAVCDHLTPTPHVTLLDDESRLALAAWRQVRAAGLTGLQEALRDSRGGRNLLELGMDRDIEFASRVDISTVVGELHLDTGRIARCS